MVTTSHSINAAPFRKPGLRDRPGNRRIHPVSHHEREEGEAGELTKPAVLSSKTFCTFVRESSPFRLREGRAKEDAYAVEVSSRTGRFSSRRGCEHAASWR